MCKITLINEIDQENIKIDVECGTNLKDILINTGKIEFPCGGKGTCGKCKVKVKERIEHTIEELSVLSQEEIKNNIHLACKIKVHNNLTITMEKTSEFSILSSININNMELNSGVELINLKPIVAVKGDSIKSNTKILGDYLKSLGKDISVDKVNIIRKLNLINEKNEDELNLVLFNNEAINIIKGTPKSYGLGVDIGTTTIVMYLYDLITGKHIDTYSQINPQRRFGYDVISRINYGDKKETLEELRFVLVNGLKEMANKLYKRNNLDLDYVNHIVFVGNTTMSHLLVGADVKNFGRVPFTPQFLEALSLDALSIGLTNIKNAKVTVLNNISSFVGGDLVAGIVDTDLDVSEGTNLLVDIGTNGEMIIGNKNEIHCCATAAGPAFEAANISCGVGSIEGAICKVYKEAGKLAYKTIGDKDPVGICGTGLIDLVAYLLEEEIIDEVGYLEDDFVICSDLNGKEISITPKDIREVQLAKSAIRAGIECLMEEVKIDLGNINKIFIAGGFGNYLNIESAIKIGLLPSCKDKYVNVGNSAGSGACKILLNNTLLERANKIQEGAKYLELSCSQSFMDKYIDNMYFEEN